MPASKHMRAALQQAREFLSAGVDILDVGGESTRPGARPVSQEEEQERVIPVIRAIVERFDTPVSVDTYRAATAQAALEAGAQIVNDIWGLHADPALAGVVAKRQVPVILMHNRSSWASAQVKERLGGRYVGIEYGDLMGEIIQELREQVWREAGVMRDPADLGHLAQHLAGIEHFLRE